MVRASGLSGLPAHSLSRLDIMTTHEQCSSCSTCNTHKSAQKPDLLPSPSTSGFVQQETHPSKAPWRELDDLTAQQASGANKQKRKRTCFKRQPHKRSKTTELDTGGHPDTQEQDEHLDSTLDTKSHRACQTNSIPIDPIQYWAHNQHWPENFAYMDQQQSTPLKSRASNLSYTQRYKNGEVPEAYSSAYKTLLVEHRMNMQNSAGRLRITKESKSLCDQLLQGNHQEPQHAMFPVSQYLSVWERAQNRNEARIFRDITPLLIPSPELLSLSGHDELEHLTEEINAEWIKCKTLGGPRPKPDFTVGLASSAFSKEELAKLRNHTSPEQPTAFTNNLYFPFVLCEVKCGEQGITRANRQNMHSGSIAVNAIVTLVGTLGSERMKALDGEILVYSASHDNQYVNLYGHFIHQGTFYRYPIASFTIMFEGDLGWKRTYDFFREVYRLVYPAHIKRIREALAAMADPRKVSKASGMSFEGAEKSNSQEPDMNVYSSQGNASFKKPGAPASKKTKSEMTQPSEQLAEAQKQIIELQRENRELMKLLTQLLQRQ